MARVGNYLYGDLTWDIKRLDVGHGIIKLMENWEVQVFGKLFCSALCSENPREDAHFECESEART